MAETTVGRRPPEREGSAPDAAAAGFEPSFRLVEAKLRPPAMGAQMVSRGRLREALSAERTATVVSIVAPAGYGKSVLLADWAAHEDRPTAWLSLDELDNEASVLLTYLAAAIDRIEPIDASIGSMLTAPGPRILARAVPRLASELHRWPRPGVIVLDDMHRLTDRGCLDALSLLLEYRPPSIRVVLAGRSIPGIALARFRAQRELVEIDRDALAFTADETRALVAGAGYQLDEAEARSLSASTEGWAAAIYLSTLAAKRGSEEGAQRPKVRGQDGHIADYLRLALGGELSGDDLELLTRTSILEVVEGQMAGAIAEVTGAAVRLKSLVRENQLISEVDGEPGSYRYHQLLRDYLQAELERREPGMTAQLHRRAAAAFEATGNKVLAVEHSFAGGDLDATASLVLRSAVLAHYGGLTERVDRWLRSFDDEIIGRRPEIAVIRAWFDAINGRPEMADRMADIAERSAFTGRSGDGSASFESARAMLRAAMARRGVEGMLADASFAVAAEETGSPWRSVALYLLGSAHLLREENDLADAAFAESVLVARRTGTSAGLALAGRASISIAAGEWADAERYARESHDWFGRVGLGEMATALIVHACLARVALHDGDPATARTELVHAQVVRPLASHVLPWSSVSALVELGKSYLAIGDPGGARTVVAQAEGIARRRPDLGALSAELVELRRRVDSAARTLGGPSTLTPAELRVLPMLSTYLSFEEIGDRLHVSRTTVKTQAVAIYGKLAVSSRSEAIDRAIEIGLLEPFPGLRLNTSLAAD